MQHQSTNPIETETMNKDMLKAACTTGFKVWILFLVFGLFFSQMAFGAGKETKKTLPRTKHFKIHKAEGSIKVDGLLNEESWSRARVIELPYEWEPGDNTPAPVKTECKILFSNGHIYFAFRCFDPEPQKIRAHLMDRDSMTANMGSGAFIRDDFVAILIDTFNENRRAFQFLINPLGVQADAIYTEAEKYEDFSWDAIWASAGKVTDFGYTVEVGIPFNQLRFPNTTKKQTWGFSLRRSYPRSSRHKISSHPQDRDMDFILSLANKGQGLENISPGRDIEVNPTLTLQRTDKRADFPNGEMESGDVKVTPGISARWGITPNMTLNATINPDFSQVEADVAQLDVNTRYALYYKEKRPFFLEGNDYFRTPLEAIFTRTVTDPVWGAKLTGKAGKNVVGFFSTQDSYNNLIFPSNQGSWSTMLDEDVFSSVFRYRRDLGKGSRVGILYTGRIGEEYANHVGGVDGFFRFSRTKSVSVQYLASSTRYPDEVSAENRQKSETFAGGGLNLSLRHHGRNFRYGFEFEDLSPDFRADAGFISRVDYRKYSAYIQPVLWGKSGGWFNQMTFKVTGEVVTDYTGEVTDSVLEISPIYSGPLQTWIWPEIKVMKESYAGIDYNLFRFRLYGQFKPFNGFEGYCYWKVGDSIDYSNFRKAQLFILHPGIKWGIGRHLYFNINHNYEHLNFQGKRVYRAHLFQSQFNYHFNVRTFFRATFQYTDVKRNEEMYDNAVTPRTKKFFTQLLFSYKLNPQTVLFLGYSENQRGYHNIDLTSRDRTFFLKIGYALGM
ncbi:MAG: carbohydrate binding family 9 domain-containing protein [bacterium]|nr:carbohydrate binding family 9 domain-containing protein [bacterium]